MYSSYYTAKRKHHHSNGYLTIAGESNQSLIALVSGNYAVYVSNTITGCSKLGTCISITVTAGDTNGNGTIDGSEVAGDTNGNGTIDGSEVAGDTNGNGTIDGTELAGDADGNNAINGNELAGDSDGNETIDNNEQLGDINGDKSVESPELCGDKNGNNVIDENEIAFDCNNDGIADNVGVEEVNNYNLSIYPNPTNSILNISFTEKLTNENNISIVNTLGQKVFNIENINNTALSIDASSFASGIYYLQVTSNQKVLTKAFTVAK